MQTRWEEKALHGRYPSRIKEADVDTKAINQWLKSSGLKAEREGLITAAQDQTLPTRAYHHHIIKDGTDPHPGSIQFFLAKPEYIHRHNNVAAYIHWKICKEYDCTNGRQVVRTRPKNGGGKGRHHN